MATKKQKQASRENIKKAQDKWQSMSSKSRSRAQPQGRKRAKPGTKGDGDWYRIIIRPKEDFVTFRYHDVGENDGDIQRLAGKRSSGSWDTQAWLINKKSAHIEDEFLVGDTNDAKGVIEQLSSRPKHIKADIFKASPRRNVPEDEKPTRAQRKARQENINKAQQSRL